MVINMLLQEKINVLSFGWMYELILVMLFAVTVVDAVSIIKCVKGGLEELKEYAELCVKYLKILMCLFAGVFFIIVAVRYTEYDGITRAIHGVIGILLLIDAAVSLYIKIKYRRKTEN